MGARLMHGLVDTRRMTSEESAIPDLVEETVDLGHGVVFSALREDGRLLAQEWG